jgi:DNA-binding LytR/AlgR family response regulator
LVQWKYAVPDQKKKFDLTRKSFNMNRVATEKTKSLHTESMTFRQQNEAASTDALSPQLQHLLQLVYSDMPVKAVYKSRFLIKKGHQFISLPVAEVRYFYSKEKICFAKTIDNKDYMIPHTIAEVEEMVSPELFFRASRKYVVSHGAIAKILVWFNGKLKVEIQPGTTEELMISRERVNSFKAWLGA